MEHILAVNTAEGVLQLALGSADEGGQPRLLAHVSLEARSRGVEMLVPALGELLREHGLAMTDVGRIACVRGPGSFTGIRLGLATALGLARGSGALLAGLDYLPLLAESALLRMPPDTRPGAGFIWALLHGRRNEVVAQGFTAALAPLGPPRAMKPADAARCIRDAGAPRFLVGSGLLRNRETFSEILPAGDATVWNEDAAALAPQVMLAAAGRASCSSEPVEPLYVRACDAEENLDGIAQRMGRDPLEAGRALERLTRISPV